MYHPHGVQLRDEEVLEVMGHFDEWSYKSGKMYGQLRYHKRGRNSLELCLGLRLFHRWFMSTCDLVSRYMEQQTSDVNDSTTICDATQSKELFVNSTTDADITPVPIDLMMSNELHLAKSVAPSIIFDSNANELIDNNNTTDNDAQLYKSLTEESVTKELIFNNNIHDATYLTDDDSDDDVTVAVKESQDDSNQFDMKVSTNQFDMKVSTTQLDQWDPLVAKIAAISSNQYNISNDDTLSGVKDKFDQNSIEESQSLIPAKDNEFNSNSKEAACSGNDTPEELEEMTLPSINYSLHTNTYDDNTPKEETLPLSTVKGETLHLVLTEDEPTNIPNKLIDTAITQVISSTSKDDQLSPSSRIDIETEGSSVSIKKPVDQWDPLDAKISEIYQLQSSKLLPSPIKANISDDKLLAKTIQVSSTDIFALKSLETADNQYDYDSSSDGASDVKELQESLAPTEDAGFKSNSLKASGRNKIPVELDVRISRVYKFKSDSMWSINNCLNTNDDNESIATSQGETIVSTPIKALTKVSTRNRVDDMEIIEKPVDRSQISLDDNSDVNSPLLHLKSIPLDSSNIDEIGPNDVFSVALAGSYSRTMKPIIKSPVMQVTLIQRLESRSHSNLNKVESRVVLEFSNINLVPIKPIKAKPLSRPPSFIVVPEKTQGNTTVQEDLLNRYNSIILAPRKPIAPNDIKDQNDNRVMMKPTPSFQRKQFATIKNDTDDGDDDIDDNMRKVATEKKKKDIVVAATAVNNVLTKVDTTIRKAPIQMKPPSTVLIRKASNSKLVNNDLSLMKPPNTVSVRSTGNNTEKNKVLSSILFRPPSQQTSIDRVSEMKDAIQENKNTNEVEVAISNSSNKNNSFNPEAKSFSHQSSTSTTMTGLSPQIGRPKILPNKLVRPPSAQSKGVDSLLSKNLYLSQVNKNKSISQVDSNVSIIIGDEESESIKQSTIVSSSIKSDIDNEVKEPTKRSSIKSDIDNEVNEPTKGRQSTPSSVKDIIKIFEPNKTQQQR